MPVQPTYPGIYIEELPSSVHTITAAPTSITVFVGYTHPFKTKQFNKPIELFSFTDYQTWFGGFFQSAFFDRKEANLFGDVAQAVNQFFLNGGADAYVVGLLPEALSPAWNDLGAFQQSVKLGQVVSPPYPAEAFSWGPLTFFPLEITDPGPNSEHVMQITISNVRATYPSSAFSSPPPSLTVPYSYSLPYSSPADETADITITYGASSSSPLAGYGVVAETYRQVSLFPNTANGKPNPNYVLTRINGVSSLVLVAINSSGLPLQATGPPQAFPPTLSGSPWGGFGTGAPVIFNPNDFENVFQQDSSLDKLSIFNLLVIPGVTDNTLGSVLATATAFCERKRAFLIMDPPRDDSADGTLPQWPLLIEDTMEGNNAPAETIPQSPNSALYFPYLTTNNPITGLAVNPVTNNPYQMPPSGTIAGIFADTDLTRGVWKAPAGLATTLTNVIDVVERGQMTDQRQGVLNPLGVNCVRNFPGTGPVVWGARTSIASNLAFQQWLYVPVRRMALFLEQTLYANLGWVVFEPNAEPLWTSIVTSIQAFMLGLFLQGAFQGSTPSQAFQVKCDSSTTTQDDINQGIVNILVAFAPLKPAEFVVIQIAQLAGQAQTS
jgi:hypothetical protein